MFDAKSYKREWMRQHRAKRHKDWLVSNGKCPIIEILLISEYHPKDCPCGYIHKKSDIGQSIV